MGNTKEIKVLDIIIALAEAVKKTETPDEHKHQYYLDDGKNRLWAAKYLLGQVLRQYRIDGNHIFVSVAADNLWKEITDGKEEMENYHYTMSVPINKECKLPLYTGATKQASKVETFTKNTKFQYRQVFHDEHVIPIADIIEKLIALDDLNYENVQSVLNNIYICRMLKSENAELTHKRPFSVVDVVETIYREKGIEIVGWEETKSKL